jgi:hypothetical protein
MYLRTVSLRVLVMTHVNLAMEYKIKTYNKGIDMLYEQLTDTFIILFVTNVVYWNKYSGDHNCWN